MLSRVDDIRSDKYTHGDADDYRRFLGAIQEFYEICPLREYDESREDVCYLRHDVDCSISGAVQMAQIEREEKVSSTYYVLQTARYFRRSSEKIRVIENMGHEVGLHHNFIAPFHRKEGKVKPGLLFLSQLFKLKRIGVNVETVAAHGDPLCRKYKISNYQIFEECPPQLERLGIFPMKLSLKEHGLREAYFFERDFYLTDTGGRWKYTFDQDTDEWNGRFLPFPIKQIQDFLGDIQKYDGVKRMILLTHPVWWTFYESESD